MLFALVLLAGLGAAQEAPPETPTDGRSAPPEVAPDPPRTPLGERSGLHPVEASIDVVRAVEVTTPEPPSSSEPSRLPDPVAPFMPWQRSLEDALTLSRATGKPLLLCANMDGEMASDRLARDQYRDPSFIALAAGFVPLIVSPSEHSSRDHDDRGRRLVDPRFGRVIDREHIVLEPVLYERYFSGTRVAPRHVGVAPDGEVLFDLYLLDHLGRIDEALGKHGRFDRSLPDPERLSEEQLLASHDAAARERLEQLFVESSVVKRGELIAAALDPSHDVRHPELLRLALRDPSTEVQRVALLGLAVAPDRLPLELATEALRVAQEHELPVAPLAEGLAARAESLEDGDLAARALRLAQLFAALGASSKVLDVELWTLALADRPLAEAVVETASSTELYAAVGRVEDRLGALDPGAAVQRARLLAALARASLRAAEAQLWSSAPDTGYLLADAQIAARDATDADPQDAFSWATLARASHLVGESPLAVEAAEHALPGMLGASASPLSAQVLEALARGRTTELLRFLDAGDAWPGHWLADVLGAYEILAIHPHGTVQQLVAGLDVLAGLELHGAHGRLARLAVERHPQAPQLHDHYRWHVQRDRGAAHLPQAYEGFEIADDVLPTWLWFDGFAQLTAADRLREEGSGEAALAVYERCIERFERSLHLEPGFGNVRDFVGLAWAGIAGVHLDAGDLQAATKALQAAAKSSAVSFRMPDALGVTPAETARRLGRALRRAGLDELDARLSATLRERGVEVRRW